MHHLVVNLISVLLLPLSSPSHVGSVTEPPDDGLDPKLLASQDVLSEIASAIVESDKAGAIATTAIDISKRSVTVTLVGEPPAPMRRVIDGISPGITVNVEPARFSMLQMQAAGRKIHQAVNDDAVPAFAAIVSNNDGSGLTVEVEKDVLASTSKKDLSDLYARAAGIPTTVVEGQAPQATSRGNAASPWRGGMHMKRASGPESCSTGFAVLRPGGYGRLLSAAHCDFDGNKAWDDWSGAPFTLGGADVAVDRVPYDTMIIDPIGGTQGRVYGGPWNATSSHARFSLGVAGADGSHVGNFICTSGANSGEHCNIVVQQLGVQWPCGKNSEEPDPPLCGGHGARRTTDFPAGVTGDSGGPVYRSHANGTVTALGIISYGTDAVPCGSTRTPPSACYRNVYYPAIRPILERWDSTIETAP